MRACVLCCAVAASAGLIVGCKGGSESKEKTGVSATHDEAVAAYKLKLDDFDKKIADLKDKASKAAGDEKVKLDAKLKDAAAKREAFEKKTGELKVAAADKWDAVKKEADAALDELRKAVE